MPPGASPRPADGQGAEQDLQPPQVPTGPTSSSAPPQPPPGADACAAVALADLDLDPPSAPSSFVGTGGRASPACFGDAADHAALASLTSELSALIARAEATAGPAAAAAILQSALATLSARAGLQGTSPRHSHIFNQATPQASALAGRALWQRALAAVTAAARSGTLFGASTSPHDPWSSARFAALPMRRATRHRYDAGRGAWTVDTVLIKLEPSPFAAGAMRECRRMVKLSTWGSAWANCGVVEEEGDGEASSSSSKADPLGWGRAPPFVAKRYRARGAKAAPTAPSVYLTDVRLQMDAKRLAEAYDRTDPPKKVDVIAACALEVHALRGEEGSKPTLAGFYAAENAISGEYVKYNSNSGYVASGEGDGCPADLGATGGSAGSGASGRSSSFDPATAARFTPQAFSHFTFEATGGDKIVVDIQGVGDYYTDPQIHSADGLGYGSGNLGVRGMALFLLTHSCNPLCRRLGLPPFQRCDADAVVAAGDGGCGEGEEEEEHHAAAEAASPRASRGRALNRAWTGGGVGRPPGASAAAVVPVGGGSTTTAPSPPSAEDAIVAASSAPHPPSRHARFHYEAARHAAEVVALAELHPPTLVTAARRAGLFHLRRAAADGWPRALGILARVAAGLPPASALLAGLVQAGLAAGEVVEGEEAGNEAVAAALAAAGARAGVRSAAAVAASYAADDPAASADWLAAALAPPEPRLAISPAVAELEAAAEAEFASLPGGGRARHELLAAAALLAARAGDVEGAVAGYEAAAEEATGVGAGKAAARYFEAAAGCAG